jgi:hypothetical protein
MYLYELIAGGILLVSGIGIGAWILWIGIRIGVNMVTRPESFKMPGETKVQMDDSTI